MGRLVAIVLVVAAAGIAVVAVNGPGKDKPEPKDKFTPGNVAAQVSTTKADGTIVIPGQPVEAAAPVGATIIMKHLRFNPETATLRKGQAVRFVNKDDVAHTVIQDFGPRSGEIAQFDTRRILPGQSFEFIARVVGKINFVCTLHPTVMTGQLTVTGPTA
jgi:plastocyanin